MYLKQSKEPVAAMVPAETDTAAAALVALEDADDIRAALAALAEPGPNIRLADVLAEYADDLTDEPNETQG